MSLKALVESQRFERLIATLIVLNAVTLGLETSQDLPSQLKAALTAIDTAFLSIFAVEIAAKLAVYRRNYLHDPWRIFDLLIVGVSLLPAAGPLTVLRSLRVLRTLRMLSLVPSLRKVVNGLLKAIPGLGSVLTIMMLLFYVGSVMATKLFGADFPEWFGSIWISSYSLFQIMTLESWSMGIVRPVMDKFPYAWVFFVPFILITTFTMLNLFVAVIVNGMQAETEEVASERAEQGHEERLEILDELRKIRQAVARLTEKS